MPWSLTPFTRNTVRGVFPLRTALRKMSCRFCFLSDDMSFLEPSFVGALSLIYLWVTSGAMAGLAPKGLPRAAHHKASRHANGASRPGRGMEMGTHVGWI